MSESPNQEPVRWLEDPSAAAALRADLGHAAKARAGGVDYAATLVALRGAIASQTGALAPAAVAGKSVGLKAVVGGLVIGGVAGLWALRSEPDPSASSGGVDRPTPGQVVQAERIEPAPARVRAVAPEQPAAGPSPAAVPIVAPVPLSPTVPPAEDAAIADSPAIESGKPSRRPRVESSPSAPQTVADDTMREAKLVALARKQLGTDAAKALASTQQHGRDFPRGVLVEERRAIEVRALAQLDRMEEARRAAEAFLREFGDGPHAAAVRRAVAGDDPVQ
jgi:hypothetical protein